MILLDFEVVTDERMEKLKPSRFKTLFRKGMKKTVLFWHKSYAPRHFKRLAYTLYSRESAYRKMKPVTRDDPGLPLVETGSLRRHILRKRGPSDVRATRGTLSVSLRLRYGRPDKYTDPQKFKAQVWKMIRKMKRETGRRYIPWKEAEDRVWKRAGYNPKVKKLFQDRMTAMHPREIAIMSRMLRDNIVAELNRPGRRRRRKL